MREEDIDKKRPTKIYKIIGLMFLVLAFIFLLAAAVLQGIDKEQMGARLVLIVIGACMTISGATIFWLDKFISTEKMEHQEQNTVD